METNESKIVSVSKGNPCIQGLENEVDGECLIMESSGSGHIDGIYMCSNPNEAEESRTINASGTLCNHVAVKVGGKDYTFPSIANKGKANGHNFCYGSDVLSPSINSTCDVKQISTTENSNHQNLCSSQNSFSENIESKAGLGVSDPYEDVEILASSDQTFSVNNYRQREPDFHGDCVSLTVGSSSSHKAIGQHMVEAFQKNEPCGPYSDNCVPPMRDIFYDRSEKKEASSESTLTQLGDLCSQARKYSDQQGTGSGKLDPSMTVTNITADNSDCGKNRELNKKSNMFVGEPNSQLHCLESQTLDSTGESDHESVEVRVCDTCGDVGRETLLALCSNCGDGAEHTYCMQVMLTEVPEDWTCEECVMEKEKENSKKNKLDKEEWKFKKTSSLNVERKRSENLGCFNSQSCTGLDIRSSGKRRLQKKASSDLVYKKSAIESRVVLKARREVREKWFGSDRVSIPCYKSRSLKNSSEVDLEKWKIKPAFGLTSSVQCSTSRIVETASSSENTGHRAARLQETPILVQGSLIKSKSFSGMDSKVSSQFQRDDKVLSKSISFNQVSSNRSNSIKSSKRLRPEEECILSQKRHKPELHHFLPRKPVTGCDPYESKRNKWSPSMSSPKIGPSTSRLKNDKWNSSINIPLKFDRGSYVPKAKAENINPSNSSRTGDHGISISKTDKMKPLISSSMVVSWPTSKTRGDKLMTSSEMSSSGGPASNNYKVDGLPNSPRNASRSPITNGYGNLSRSQPPVCSSALKSNTNKRKLWISSAASDSCVPKSKNSKESSSVSSPMNQSGVSASTYTGKPLMSSLMSASTVPSFNNREKTSKVSFPKAVSASMTHEGTSSIDLRVTKLSSASRCYIPKVPVEYEKPSRSSRGDTHLIQKGMNYDKNKVSSDLRHDHPPDPVAVARERIMCTTSPDQNLSCSVAPLITTLNFTAPHFDKIWLGDFDIYKCEKLPSFSGGIQAHLSMNASSKVVKAVHKLPKKLLLQEVPRMSIWPTQFYENQATEDNIALFFFAEDIESYEKTYKNLVQCMIDYDLALEGNFGEFDVLIFSSKLLTERFQRWNNLLFIWGVFKGKRVQIQSSEPIESSEIMIGNPTSNSLSTEKTVAIVRTEHMSGKLVDSSDIEILQQSAIVTSDRTLVASEEYFQQEKCTESLGVTENKSMEYKRICQEGLESRSEVKRVGTENNEVLGERKYTTTSFSPKLCELGSFSSIEDSNCCLSRKEGDISICTDGQSCDKTYDATGYEQEGTKISANLGSLDGCRQQQLHPKEVESRLEYVAPHLELTSAEETPNGVTFPSWDTENRKNDQKSAARADSDHRMNVDNEMTASLSLSLQLSGANNSQLSESNCNRKSLNTEESGVNTPVYLFGSNLKI